MKEKIGYFHVGEEQERERKNEGKSHLGEDFPPLVYQFPSFLENSDDSEER